MIEEQEYKLALAATQACYQDAKKHACNEYPLDIDDELYNLIQPGLYFTELSWRNPLDNLIYHRITIRYFGYDIGPIENSAEIKFRVIDDSFQSFAVQMSESDVEYERGWTKGMVDAIITKLVERAGGGMWHE